jgi:hypothetical protein
MGITGRRATGSSGIGAFRGNGDQPHCFAKPLPREESWRDACEQCEREIDPTSPPHGLRCSRGRVRALPADEVA